MTGQPHDAAAVAFAVIGNRRRKRVRCVISRGWPRKYIQQWCVTECVTVQRRDAPGLRTPRYDAYASVNVTIPREANDPLQGYHVLLFIKQLAGCVFSIVDDLGESHGTA